MKLKKIFLVVSIVLFIAFLYSGFTFNNNTTSSMNWTSIRFKLSVGVKLIGLFSVIFLVYIFLVIKINAKCSMNKSISIKFQDHFKLYVLFKDKIIFEDLLFKNGIKFYNENSEALSDSCRYFLLSEDRNKIDVLLIANEIIASTETIPTYDYRENIKIQKTFLYIALIVIVLLLIVMFLFD